MKILELIKLLEQEFPLNSAVDCDRIGLQIQSTNPEIKKIHILYELNSDTINEAIKLNSDLIISFHPLIYSPLQSIVESDRVGRLSSEIIRNNMSLYVIHTNFDTYKNGTNVLFANNLDLEIESYLLPNEKYTDRGMGIIARGKEKELFAEELLQRVKKICNSPVKISKFDKSKKCKKIAIICGSGSSYISEAIEQNCDTIITADCSYHKFHEAEGKIMIIDPGHNEMEKFVAKGLFSAIKKLINENIAITYSEINTNPIFYL